MDLKKIVLILIIAAVLIYGAFTIFGENKSYEITEACVDLNVSDTGLLYVNETYDYIFHGSYNGTYRQIPLKYGESIDDLKIHVDGAYATFDVSKDKNNIKVYLWEDEAHTQKIHDCEVIVSYAYKMKNVTKLYKDTASLQYKLWGDEWDVSPGKLTANIHLPGDNFTYYLNPKYFTLSSSNIIDSNTIHTERTFAPFGEYYEIQVLMPLDDFKYGVFADHENKDGKDKIISDQADFNFWETVYAIIALIFFIIPISHIIIYLKYGREPKVDYDGIYERDPPTDDPPAVVNALIDDAVNGQPDLKGFEASIMDLINRKVFEIYDDSENTDDLMLKLNENKYSELPQDEKDIFDILKEFSDDNILNVSRFRSKLNSETKGKWFVKQYENWKEDVMNLYIRDKKLGSYYIMTGEELSMIISLICIPISGIMIVLSSFLKQYPTLFIMYISSIFLIVTSFIAIMWIIMFSGSLGRWSPEGRVYYLKWKNFKKFLKDNSLIKEHPPESIVIWNKYLVYGTALGVADKVYESMKIQMPELYNTDSVGGYDNLYSFHESSGLTMLDGAFSTGFAAANPSDSSGGGGSGGVGGGSGGGGGGAF